MKSQKKITEILAQKKNISPCPHHGLEFAKIIENKTIVCFAETPGDISDHCWWHIATGVPPGSMRICPDCKSMGYEVAPKRGSSYCHQHAMERQRKRRAEVNARIEIRMAI